MGIAYQLFAMMLADAAILWLALTLLARDEADTDFAKVLMVAAPIVVAPLILQAALVEHLPILLIVLITPIIVFPLAVYLISKYCWIPWPRAIAVTAVLYLGHVAVNFGIIALRNRVHAPPSRRPRPAATRPPPTVQTVAPSPAKASPAESVPVDAPLRALRGYAATRMSWHKQLAALRQITDDLEQIQLTELRVATTIRESGRTTQLELRGCAKGPMAQAAVAKLRDALRTDPFAVCCSDVRVTRFETDPTSGAAKGDRVFVMTCSCGKQTAAHPPNTPLTPEQKHDLLDATRNNMLTPRLTNFLLPAGEQVEAWLREEGLGVESLREIGMRVQPHSKGKKAWLQAYSVRIVAKWDYDALVRFLKRLETANALVRVPAFSLKNSITLDIEWPVWREAGTAERVSAEP